MPDHSGLPVAICSDNDMQLNACSDIALKMGCLLFRCSRRYSPQKLR